MKLTEIIAKAQEILGEAVMAEQTEDRYEAINQMEKLHDLMHENYEKLPGEQPTELPAQVEQPAESAAEPESKPGSGVVSEPAKSESQPGAGVVSEPDKSQNKPGSGVS